MTYKIRTVADSDDGQRPCAREARCLEATIVTGAGGAREIRAALGYRAFCDSDRDLALRVLEALPAYHRELGERIGDKSNGHGPKVSGSRDAPVPINLTFDELRVDMVTVLVSWAQRVALAAKITFPEVDRSYHERLWYGAPLTASPQSTFDRVCELIAAHLDTLFSLDAGPMTRFLSLHEAAGLPEGTVGQVHPHAGFAEAVLDLDGADAGLELFRLNGRARWLLGYTGKDEKITGRCFSCEQLDVLVRPDTAAGLVDHAECSACGTRYFGAEYTMLLRAAYEAELAKQKAS